MVEISTDIDGLDTTLSCPGSWRNSTDSDVWPISRSLRAVATEACFLTSMAMDLLADSPSAVMSLATAATMLAKYQYREWRRPRIHYNIYHLPDELLAYIIELSLITDSPVADPLAAVPPSHISRRFMSVVLSHPKLWATVSTSMSLHWNRLAAKRSQKAPLDVRCDHLELSKDVSDIARDHSPRWKSLYLVVGNGPQVYGLPILRQFRSLDLASLETLRIIYRSPTYSGYKAIDDNVHCYGRLRAPKLNHLEFINVIPRSFSQLKSRFTLTKLTFIFASCWNYRCGESREHFWNFVRLLQFLEEMKNVTELELVLRVHDLTSTPLLPTELPQITKFSLRIEDSIGDVVEPFLHALCVPNMRTLSFALAYSTEECCEGEDDPWTRESCAINICLPALLDVRRGLDRHLLQFTNLADLSLDVQVELDFIKDEFCVPFYRMPALERLQVRTNRNVFVPKAIDLKTMPRGSLPLKQLELTECYGMEDLTWLSTLSEYVNHDCLERVVVEGELGTSDSLESFFTSEKIQMLKRKSGVREDVAQYISYLY